MAPEQAQGRLDQLGPTTDVYGLGAILYEILTGQAPFTGTEMTTVVRQVIHDTPTRPRAVVAGVPAALEAVCLKALAKKIAERYGSAKELAGEVQHWLADEPVRAYRESLTKRAGRWARRHPALVAGAAVLLVSAVVALSISTVLIERERARAEESFRKARATVDDYFTTVSESRLLDVPGLQPLRKQLLEKALNYYEGFLNQRGNDPAVRAEAAATSYRLARISQLLGSADAAVTSYRKALDLYEQLVRARPGVPKYQSELAVCCNDFGNWLRSLGQTAEALRLHRQALEYREALVLAHPGNAGFQNELAKSNANLGGLLYAAGQPVEALAEYEKARAINETLVRAHSSILEEPIDVSRAANIPRGFLLDLAIDHGSMSAIQLHLGQSAEALRSSRQGAALLEGLVVAHPSKSEYRSHLVGSYNQIAYLLSRSGQLAEAMDSYQKARTLLERLVEENPHVPDFQNQLAGTYNYLGRLKRDQGHAAEALPFHQQALAIQEKLVRENPGVVSYQATLANLHRSLGRLQAQTGQNAEALQGFRQAQALDEPYAATSPLSCYNLACDLALCISIVDANERPRIADQALETLRRAIRSGYQDFHLIKTDPDLNALRQREDFQKLMQELEAKGKEERP
jgi:serine/threonine-protein kinase